MRFKIILSELDFDYELQALVNSFFSGQRSSVEVGQELTASSMKEILSEKKEKTCDRYMFSDGKDYDWSVLQ